MEIQFFNARNEQRQQQSHQLPMSLMRRGGALTMQKQASPAERLQRLMMQQARNQSGSL